MKYFIQGYPADNWKYWNSVWLGGDLEKYFRIEFLKTQCAHKSPGGLVKMQILNSGSMGWAPDVCILTSLELRAIILFQGPHFKYQGFRILVLGWWQLSKPVKTEFTGHMWKQHLQSTSIWRINLLHDLSRHELLAVEWASEQRHGWSQMSQLLGA